jgi:hypothetical protein
MNPIIRNDSITFMGSKFIAKDKRERGKELPILGAVLLHFFLSYE